MTGRKVIVLIAQGELGNSFESSGDVQIFTSLYFHGKDATNFQINQIFGYKILKSCCITHNMSPFDRNICVSGVRIEYIFAIYRYLLFFIGIFRKFDVRYHLIRKGIACLFEPSVNFGENS